MRTTVELPPDLFRQAKARAAARGESFKTLLTRAVAAEVGHDREVKRRVTFPLFGTSAGPRVKMRSTDLARALADADAAAVGGRRQRRR